MDRKSFDEEAFREDLADYLADLTSYRMPFGRFKHAPIYDLPIEYLTWFLEKGGGFPGGRLGELMEFVYHVKADGAEMIFVPLRNASRDPF